MCKLYNLMIFEKKNKKGIEKKQQLKKKTKKNPQTNEQSKKNTH